MNKNNRFGTFLILDKISSVKFIHDPFAMFIKLSRIIFFLNASKEPTITPLIWCVLWSKIFPLDHFSSWKLYVKSISLANTDYASLGWSLFCRWVIAHSKPWRFRNIQSAISDQTPSHLPICSNVILIVWKTLFGHKNHFLKKISHYEITRKYKYNCLLTKPMAAGLISSHYNKSYAKTIYPILVYWKFHGRSQEKTLLKMPLWYTPEIRT